jgi:hypothetical protein
VVTSVNAVLGSVVNLLKSKVKAKHAVIKKQWDKDVELTAVAGELRQVFSNLLTNSLDAMDKRASSCCGCLPAGTLRDRVDKAGPGRDVDGDSAGRWCWRLWCDPGQTPRLQFQQLLNTLQVQTKATLIVANIPDVTVVPYLTPAATILAQVAAETGLSQTQVATALGIQDGDLVNTTGQSQVQSAVNTLKQGQTPTPLTDAGFLDAGEIAAIQSMVIQYNTVIAQEVTAVGGVLVDIHAFIQNLAQNGITINNYQATATFLGGLFGLDGIHPTNTGYALIANEFIDTMNTSLKATFADVNVSAIAAADPLFGPNIKLTGAVSSIPLNAARRADRMISPRNGAGTSEPLAP